MRTGFELELLTLEDGIESNKADAILALAHKQGVNVVPECSHCMVEVNSKAGEPSAAAKNLTEQLANLEQALMESNLQTIPIEQPLNTEFTSRIRTEPRYQAKENLLGKERFDICKKIMGFHAHYDLMSDEEERAQQINFLTIFDPLAITLTASSPREIDGQTIHNYRAYSYRHVAHEDMPFQGNLQKFTETYDTYLEQLKKEYDALIEKSRTKGSGLEHHATMYDAIWGPVRINNKYNTVELRSLGACPNIALPIGSAILGLGGLRQIPEFKKPNSLISFLLENPDPEESFAFINAMSNDAIRYGLSSDVVRAYCHKIAEFCLKGLRADEFALVQNALNVLETGETYSTRILAAQEPHKELYAKLIDEYRASIETMKVLLR